MILITQYLFRIFGAWFGAVFIMLGATTLLFDFIELLRRGSGRSDVDVGELGELLILKFPFLMEQLFPFVVFIASIMTFWRVARFREIIAFKASGISVWQCILPLSALVTGIGTLYLFFVNPITSTMIGRFDHLEGKYFGSHKDSLMVSQGGVWLRQNETGSSSILHIDKINPKSRQLEGITIFKFNEKDEFQERLEAKTGQLENKSLSLQSGLHYIPQQGFKTFESVTFPTPLNFDKLRNTSFEPHTLSFWKLPSFITVLEEAGLSTLKHRLYWNGLISGVFWLGAMVILGAVGVVGISRYQKPVFLIGFAIVVCLVLYFIKDVAFSMGGTGKIPPFVGAWIPIIVSYLIGCSLLFHREDG